MNVFCNENGRLILLAERIDKLGFKLSDLIFTDCLKLLTQYLLYRPDLPYIGFVVGIGNFSYSYHYVYLVGLELLTHTTPFPSGDQPGISTAPCPPQR